MKPPKGFNPYVYHAEVLRVVDGDTVDVKLDLGIDTYRHIRLRTTYDAWESRHREPEHREKGKLATKALEEYLRYGEHGSYRKVIVHTEKDRTGKYGRYLAHIFADGREESAREWMERGGHLKEPKT